MQSAYFIHNTLYNKRTHIYYKKYIYLYAYPETVKDK